MSLYTLTDVGFAYGQVPALQDVSLTIGAGERIAIVGANGSGKSTLLRLLAGLAFRTSGRLQFESMTLEEDKLDFAIPFRRKVQMLFQNSDAQLFCPTVEEEIAFGPLQMGYDEVTVRGKLEAVLEITGTKHLRTRSPHRLSGGEKKRVALAAVLAIGPEVFLLDEPTASLDPRTQAHTTQFLAELPPDRTVITATHDLHLLPELATRCLVFADGRLIADDGVEAILGRKALLEEANLVYRRRSV